MNSKVLFDEVVNVKQQYLKNKFSFLSDLKKKYKDAGISVLPKNVYFEVSYINDTFNNICENIDKIRNNFGYLGFPDDYIDIDCRVVNSQVNEDVRIHPQIVFDFGGNGIVSLCPLGDNDIEISAVRVDSEQGNGFGTLMMLMVMITLSEYQSNLNNIILECVGAIGYGSNRKVSTISQQTKFFRKFGFRVIKDKKVNGELSYVKMGYDDNKWDPIDTMNELKNKGVFKNK